MGKTAPQEPSGNRPFYDLVGFARLFIRTHSIKRHQDVRTEDLTEDFRRHMGLPPFPTIDELLKLCHDLQIELGELPKGSPFPGANTSYGPANKMFLLPGLPTTFTESTVGHEIREIIERALQSAVPSYVGLDTSNNKEIHAESEHFGLCLLMQAEATHRHLSQIGYDVVRFAEERGRSLPSVIMRAQTLYKAGGTWPGPVAGLWLYLAPTKGNVNAATLKVKYSASLRGFSTAKSGSATARRANLAFPSKGAKAEAFEPAREAIELREAVARDVSLSDLFGEEIYLVVAEPLCTRDRLWRVMVTAIRKDCIGSIRPWLQRLGLDAVG